MYLGQNIYLSYSIIFFNLMVLLLTQLDRFLLHVNKMRKNSLQRERNLQLWKWRVCQICNSSQSRITIWQTLWPAKPFSPVFFFASTPSSSFPYVVFNRFLLFVFLFEDQKAYLCKMKKCFYLLLTPPLSLHYELNFFQ